MLDIFWNLVTGGVVVRKYKEVTIKNNNCSEWRTTYSQLFALLLRRFAVHVASRSILE